MPAPSTSKRLSLRGIRLPRMPRGATALCALLMAAASIQAENQHLATLRVGAETYTNVTVTSVSATEIFFSHSRGLCNAKLKNLDPELQKLFHLDPAKAIEVERQQAEANAVFLSEVQKQPRVTPVSAPEEPRISVEVAEPTVEYKYWSLSGEKPPEIRGERQLGNTRANFECHTDFTLQPTKGTNVGPFTFHVVSANLSLALPMIITLPIGGSAKLKAHEEDHRKINEHFYALGRRGAEHAGELILGRDFDSKAIEFESAQADVLARASAEAKLAYWKYTRLPAGMANNYYDELTEHGTKNIDTDQALQDSVERAQVLVPRSGP